MKLFKMIALTAIGTVALSVGAQAATVLFQDNFDTNTLALNGTPSGWTVTKGTVDLIGRNGVNTSYDFLPGNGVYVDMDGSTNHQGTIRTNTTFNFVPGVTYTLSYQLAGNQRVASGPGSVDRVRVLFRDLANNLIGGSTVHNLAYSTGFTTFTQTFSVGAPVTARLIFAAVSRASDNIGLLLDNVKLTSVPLPGAALLLLSGIAGLGAFARRRRIPLAAA